MNRHTYAQLVTGTHPGYGVQQPVDVRERFAALGIVSEQPIVEAHGIMKRPGPQPSWVIVLPKGVRIPAAAWDALETGAYCNGNLYVVQFKKGA